jgi:RNA polymerase sigma factor (sigma-70 family)
MDEAMAERQHGTEDPGEGGSPGWNSAHSRAISDLFEAHNRTLVSFLVNRLGSEAEAKEVAQEAYVRLLQLHEPNTVSFLRAYLFRVAANLAVDRLRSRSRSERYDTVRDPDELTDTLEPERQVSASEALHLVRQALRELPPRYQQVFYLDRAGGKTAIQIGQELGIGERQVRTYLRRILVYCQQRLDGIPAESAMERVLTL